MLWSRSGVSAQLPAIPLGGTMYCSRFNLPRSFPNPELCVLLVDRPGDTYSMIGASI